MNDLRCKRNRRCEGTRKHVQEGKINNKKKIENFTKRLVRNILEKTYDSSAIAFIILKGIGA